MKIGKLHLTDHPFFGTIDIDFTDSEGKPSDTVVFAGINGSGKTTILNHIKWLIKKGKILHGNLDPHKFYAVLTVPETGKTFHLTNIDNPDMIEHIFVFFTDPERKIINESKDAIGNGLYDSDDNLFSRYANDSQFKNDKLEQKNFIRQLPKLIFLPSETNFDQIEISNKPYTYTYSFFNQVDENIAGSVPDFFATFIDKKVYENEELPTKESVRQACDEINAIFNELDLESHLIGLKKDGSRMPVFRNKTGKEFDINGLSSGEKQLFFRIMALKMFEANNSVILVDEPEISLHPAWQQKILKVYEKIGENNQVIVATHSPHIIASTPKENVKILTRKEENGTFQVIDYNDIHVAKGAPAERILKDIMGLSTTRDPEIQGKIDFLWELIYKGKFETEEFKNQYEELEDLLGTIDEDMVLMKMEIGKNKWEMQKDAESQ